MTERNVELKSDPILLRSALLFIMLAAWSGDKYHTDVSLVRAWYIRSFVGVNSKHASLV